MRGRVRLHIPVLKTEKGLACALAHHLGQQPGVKTVRINQLAANVVATFDPSVADANVLVAEVARYNPDPAEIEHWLAVDDAAELDAGQRHTRQRLELAMVLGAMVLPMLFGAAAGIVAQLLFWGSIASIILRTYRFVPKDRRATLDAAAAAGMALLLLIGMAGAAALIPIAFVAAPWLRSKLAAPQARRNAVHAAAEHDDVVIFIPGEQREAPAAPSHNALRSSIIGGLAVWVASKSVQRSAQKTLKKAAEKAAR